MLKSRMAFEIDAHIRRWILEYLASQPLDDRLSNFLIGFLPVSNDDLGLKKSILLRKLESEVAKQSISETLLDLLEQIQELDFQAGNIESSGSIKVAYLAVAVSCTVIFLTNGCHSSSEYLDAVKRIWRERVCKLEKTEAAGLISEELWSWKDDIVASVQEESASCIMLERSEGIDALEAMGLYVKEEKKKLGPSFLESVAEELRDNRMDLLGDGQNAGSSHENIEMHKGKAISRLKQIAWQHSRGAFVGTSRGAKTAVKDTSDGDKSCKMYDFPTTREVNRVHCALKLSSLNLQAVVNDPLPESLLLAEKVASDISRKNTINESMEGSLRRIDPPVVQGFQPTQANKENLCNHSNMPQNNGSKSSFLAQNSAACTFEDTPMEGCRVRLPSPKNRAALSPLKPYESCKLVRRRKRKRWDASEEEALRTGVEKFGKGNWTLILQAYRSIFEGSSRTSGDLKDKWRNLCAEK